MFRFFFIFFFLMLLNATASEKKSCYSVELLSQLSSTPLSIKNYPSSCLKMDIGKFSVVRCGCYKAYSNAKSLLSPYKKKFSDAHIVTTYRYRFQQPSTPIKNKPPLVTFKNEVNIFNHSYDFFDINITVEKDSSVLETMKSNLLQNRNIQLSKIENSFNLSGLSLDARYDQYLKSTFLTREYTDYEYNLKLKYDFFKHGYMEHEKLNTENKNQVKITFYKSLGDIEKYSYEERLANIQTLLPLINFNYYQMLEKVTKENLIKNHSLYSLGDVAKYEILLKEKKLLRYETTTKNYKNSININIDQSYFQLLKHIETLNLQTSDDLKVYIRENNPQLLLQQNLYGSLENSNSYFDNVKVNVYISHRTLDENGWYNAVGIDGNFPLDFSSSQANELQKLKQTSLYNQKEALEKFLDNTLDKLLRAFKNLQFQVQNNEDELKIMNYKLKRYEQLEKNNLSALHLNIHEKIYLLQENMLKTKYNISLSKLELLKMLIHIGYLMNTSNLNLIMKVDR